MKFFTPERLYSFLMFLEQFVDQETQKLASARQAKLRQENTELQTKRSLAQTKLDDVNRAYQIGASSFRSWAATRSTTGDDSQNDELIRRSEQLDGVPSCNYTASYSYFYLVHQNQTAKCLLADLQRFCDFLTIRIFC